MLDTVRTQGLDGLILDRCWVDGAWIQSDNGATLPVTDPATDVVIGHVPLMRAPEAHRAVKAASIAFRSWSKRTALERSDLMWRWHNLILDDIEKLARLLTAEQGKPLAEASGEIAYAASFIRFFAEEARRSYGEVIPPHQADSRMVVIKQPIGVVACITPWNFPAAMITRKVAPALAAGCTVVIKPAEATPFTALALCKLAEIAGFPPGVVNVVTGDPQAIGAELCVNPDVRKLSFTGSTPVGRLLAKQCADTIKKLSLELGGNAPFIIFDDADLDAAIEGALVSKFRHSGQTCVCTNRFLVQSGIYSAFLERFAERVRTLKVGRGFEDGVEIGPLINGNAVSKVETHVADALNRGATLVTGGRRDPAGANFYTPTILSDVSPDMLLMNEETFGPVAAVMKFDSEAEAIRIANDTEYGLAGYFFTRDAARTWRVAEDLECGMVGVNSGLLSVDIAPFGGIKQSGLGREGSRHGLDEFLELKYLNIGGISS